MSITVETVRVVDGTHYNGDSFWDGDQTLYRLEASEGGRHNAVHVVVPRGNAFITPGQVRRYVETSGLTLAEMLKRAKAPSPSRPPQLHLPIEPGF